MHRRDPSGTQRGIASGDPVIEPRQLRAPMSAFARQGVRHARKLATCDRPTPYSGGRGLPSDVGPPEIEAESPHACRRCVGGRHPRKRHAGGARNRRRPLDQPLPRVGCRSSPPRVIPLYWTPNNIPYIPVVVKSILEQLDPPSGRTHVNRQDRQEGQVAKIVKIKMPRSPRLTIMEQTAVNHRGYSLSPCEAEGWGEGLTVPETAGFHPSPNLSPRRGPNSRYA